ncbi:MAG: pyridoxal phosphate-dependent decarboxylase family protein, partial [Pseudonocardiaceae bacterium]
YVSDQAHSSLARAARVLGFRPDQVRVLPADASYRLAPGALAAAMDADLDAGRTPLLVSVSAGATNTGAIDPLPELAALCRERGVWLHADAAYGGFAVLTERGQERLAGLDLADSVTLDPHKWLYQPYECGCLLVRDGRALRAAFEILPDYLRDAEAAEAEVNFADLGMQLTRTSRALKCWMSLRYFGVEAFRAAIDRSLDLAALAAERIERSEALELMTPPSLGVVCFRRRLSSAPEAVDACNARLVATLEESDLALVSSTRLDGRYAIRLCVLNHTTSAEDVEATLGFLETAAVSSGPPPATESHERERDVTSSWVFAELVGDAPVALLPLFHGLTPDEVRSVKARATDRAVEAGEVIVGQWDLSKEIFVLVEGEA